ncbi:aluminium resistance protein [Firmicutes bacterium CAG:552]|nr:MAG: hypothetical protein BHW39_10940 [Firmicutes bacterium CAG:552_39_19]CDB26847.1 aluminium resistance protein [Firmicutes bacterium CAG:552]
MLNIDIDNLIENVKDQLKPQFAECDDIALYNQNKVLEAFRKNKIALRHFNATTGYGYDDAGRDTLNRLFADTFGAEDALVSPYFTTGTHTISTALFGLLRPGDTLLSISGAPYDTLIDVISGNNIGSLKDFGVDYRQVNLTENGKFDNIKIKDSLQSPHSVIYIQRSRGYSFRNAFTVEDIENIIKFVRGFSSAPIIVDNCYGEFTQKKEPTEVGADLIMGSLIKNPGGGLAPTGGYIAGKADLIKQIAFRMTAPGVGSEVGSYAFGYRLFYQGFFMAPHITMQAVKSALTFSKVFRTLGYNAMPFDNTVMSDIICSIKFDSKEQLVSFIQSVQYVSPIDSFVTPYPWDMPGYADQVIMAAGAFVQGSSIELSADSPIKEPYVAYLQGGLTYEHALIAIKKCVQSINDLRR